MASDINQIRAETVTKARVKDYIDVTGPIIIISILHLALIVTLITRDYQV